MHLLILLQSCVGAVLKRSFLSDSSSPSQTLFLSMCQPCCLIVHLHTGSMLLQSYSSDLDENVSQVFQKVNPSLLCKVHKNNFPALYFGQLYYRRICGITIEVYMVHTQRKAVGNDA